MKHETQVQFQGEVRTVDFEYEGDGVIVWSFEGEDVCYGAQATKKEQDAISAHLWAYLEDWWKDSC